MTGAEVRGAIIHSTYAGGLTAAQLYSTASYQSHDLTGIYLGVNDLSGWNFAGQNLTNAKFDGATLTNVELTGAVVRAANFADTTSRGFTAAQLYSTASYQAHDLTGINLMGNDLRGWNFVGQDLSSAALFGADLSQANLTGASFRGARFEGADLTRAEVRGAGLARVWDKTFGGFVSGIVQTQLYSTASYQSHDLTGIRLSSNDLSGWNFAGQNLTDANFDAAALTAADFTGADIRSASFGRRDFYSGIDAAIGTGITLAQLYSTASYQSKDLRGIGFDSNNLAGGNFVGQNLAAAIFSMANLTGANLRHANLANAYFYAATLTGADLTAADARGAFGLNTSDATTANLIRQDGHIDGLDVVGGELLVVRDYDGAQYDPVFIPITVDQHSAIGPGGTLQLVFEADAWDSTISFAPSIPVTLGGTLELTFADDVNLASQVGRTFELFDWTGVHPTGAFAIASPYAWDLSNLYTTGDVTLAAVPEPHILLQYSCALSVFVAMRRIRLSSYSAKGEKR
jgi:uncharacterized protein YjbI with pentapeptide repeats